MTDPEITPEQNPALLEAGLNYHIGPDGKEQLFASVEVTGLTNAQIAALREYAKAMREAGVLDLLNG